MGRARARGLRLISISPSRNVRLDLLPYKVFIGKIVAVPTKSPRSVYLFYLYNKTLVSMARIKMNCVGNKQRQIPAT